MSLTTFRVSTGLNIDTSAVIDASGNWIGSVIPIISGGTGATDAATARINLGAIGLDSPAFTGNPTAPTPSTGDSSTSIATTAFVQNTVSTIVGTTNVIYKGTVDASAATPLAAGVSGNPQTGWMYLVTTSGSSAFSQTLLANDFVLYVTGTWYRLSGTNISLTAGSGIAVTGTGITTNGSSYNYNVAINPAWIGQTSITVLGTITSGVWNATPIDIAHGGTGATTAAQALINLGAASLSSPAFTGTPTVPTPSTTDNSTLIANTAFVNNYVTSKLTGYALLDSPVFTGTALAPTPALGDNSTKIATTAFVNQAISNALIGGLIFKGTADATKTVVQNSISNPVSGWAYRITTAGNAFITGTQLYIGDWVIYDGSAWNKVASVDPPVAAGVGISVNQNTDTSYTISLASGIATPGTYTQVTVDTYGRVTAGSNPTTVAGYGITDMASISSPNFTGTPTAPTAAPDTNTTQIATTAFVLGQASSSLPLMDGTASAGSGTRFARGDHVHPSDTSKAPINSPAFTGIPTVPTASSTSNSTQIASTAFVQSALSSQLSLKGTVDPSLSTLSDAGIVNPQIGWTFYATTSSATLFGFYVTAGDFVFYDGSAWHLIDCTLPTISGSSSISVLTDGQGNYTLNLASVTNAGGGTLNKTTIDSYGRVTGYSAATPSDVTSLLGYTPWDAANTPVNKAGDVMTGTLQVLSEQYTFVDKGTVSSGTITCNLSSGNWQRIQVGGALTLAIAGWPSSGTSAQLILELVNGNSSTITWPSLNWIKLDGTTQGSPTRNLQTTGTDWIVFWSRDGGSTVYAKLM